MKLLFAALLLSVCLTCITANLKINPCNNRKTALTIKKLEVNGCNKYPCNLERGTNATLRLEFQANQRVNSLKLSIAGIIQGKEVPFAVNDEEHCKLAVKGAKCPLLRGKTYKYEYSIPVLQQYPKISVNIRYAINDNTGRQLACFTWPASIN